MSARASLAALILVALPARAVAAPPARLADTGLFADAELRRIAPDVLPFAPQYPLWTDGAAKGRWVRLPPGTSIDARDPDAWEFPPGTRFWKEFRFGKRVETRFMERLADGSWSYATYLWNDEGTDAVLAPARGLRSAAATALGVPHDVPSRYDCVACHGAGPTAVLGFSALQLSPDRDPLAPHAEEPPPGGVDLPELVRRGLLRNLPASLLRTPPRVRAATPVARAAQGYLHGNCAGCHDARGELASLELDLTQRVVPTPGAGPLATAVDVPARWAPGGDMLARIAPGAPDTSALLQRVGSRDPAAQMPPVGSRAVDRDAVQLLRAWIAELEPRSNGPHVARTAPLTPEKKP